MNTKKKKKFQIKSKHLLTFFLLLCMALIATTFFYEEAAEPFKTAFSKVIIPLQKGTNSIGTAILDFRLKQRTIDELTAENESLKQELEELKSWNQSMSTHLDALSRLEDMYDLDYSYEQYPKIAAKVIGRNTGNWFRQFTIDKGTDDGISPGMNVLTTGGLVGIISDCGKNYSVVRSIIDEESNVSSVVSEENELCMLLGSITAYDEGYLELIDLSKEAEVPEGAAIVTSQISSEFLPGLLIGYVYELENDKNNLTKSGKVKLAVDFSQINEVFVLTTLKKDYTDETLEE